MEVKISLFIARNWSGGEVKSKPAIQILQIPLPFP